MLRNGGRERGRTPAGALQVCVNTQYEPLPVTRQVNCEPASLTKLAQAFQRGIGCDRVLSRLHLRKAWPAAPHA